MNNVDSNAVNIQSNYVYFVLYSFLSESNRISQEESGQHLSGYRNKPTGFYDIKTGKHSKGCQTGQLVSWRSHLRSSIIIIAVYLVTLVTFETFQERGCEDEEILFFSSIYFYLIIIIMVESYMTLSSKDERFDFWYLKLNCIWPIWDSFLTVWRYSLLYDCMRNGFSFFLFA